MRANKERRPSVLVVDDDDAICSFLEELLVMDGFDVGIAHDYRTAVRELRRSSYDHVLIDFLYPQDPDRRDGVDVLRAAKRLCPGIRAYLMTGLAGSVPIEPLLDQGFDGFLAKPFSVSTVRVLFGQPH